MGRNRRQAQATRKKVRKMVPKGQARIRTQMNAALTTADLDFALDAFTKAGKATGVLK